MADILTLDPVRRGGPSVVAGADRLDTPVRWVHSAEVTDLAHLLHGGELVLTTGIALPEEPSRLRSYVAELAKVGVSGLMVELGRKYFDSLPKALVAAAEEHGLPLVACAREILFVDVSEAVHELIIDVQLREMRASERLHEVFTQLSVDGAPPAEVVGHVARLAGRPAVLENLSHQVLAAQGGDDLPGLLESWETRSRAVHPPERTGYDASARWLVTVVGARGEDWGRLIVAAGGPPSPHDLVLIERAATTLALGRLLDRHAEGLERQAHGSVISGILAHSYADPQEAAARARALGVPLTGRRLLGIVVRLAARDGATEPGPTPPGPAPPGPASLAEATAAACRETGLSALVGTLDDGTPNARVGVLATLAARAQADAAVTDMATRLRDKRGAGFVLAAGSVVEAVRDVRRSLLEADHVAEVAARTGDGERLFYRLPDLRLRGLLHLLRDDARLQTFIERELGPLLDHDARTGGDLVRVLRAYLGSGRNKAMAARRAHLSRPALYDRLHRLERVLGTDLDDAESCLSLHVALLALDSVRRG